MRHNSVRTPVARHSSTAFRPEESELASHPDATVNHAGGLAFRMPATARLATMLFASFGEDTFYTRRTKRVSEEGLAAIKAVAAENPRTVLQLAAYARRVANMRTQAQLVLAVAADIPACKPFVRQYTPQIVRRADELTESPAAWITLHGPIGDQGELGGTHAFPNCLKKGLADASHNFGEYAYAKYNAKGRKVTFRDVLRIVHAKPKDKAEEALFNYLIYGNINEVLLPKIAARAKLLKKETLDTEAIALAAQCQATWEVLSSKFGRSAATWDATAPYLPFMAGIRNLGNIMEVGADKALTRVVGMLRNRETVLASRQLPFRFYSAHKAVLERSADNDGRRGEVLDALQGALDFSVDSFPKLPGRTLVVTDNSASMDATLSKKSIVSRKMVGNLMGAMAHRLCSHDSIVAVFGETFKVVPISGRDSVLTNMEKLNGTNVGHSTNAHLALQWLRTTKTKVDRIMLFSDMQCYGGSLAEELRRYRAEVNPNARMISIDLADHGTMQVPASDPLSLLVAGWSNDALKQITLHETGGLDPFLEQVLAWDPFAASPKAPVTEEEDDDSED
ncbi:TROVE domain-containing protein [Patescibacteria group bacterium]|nr:TROVE domain-containing protein [Patescibacteria group bacterium]